MAAVLASNVERAGHQTDEGEGDRERYGGGCVHVRKDCECGHYKENHRENDRKESDDPQFAIMTLNQPAFVDVIALHGFTLAHNAEGTGLSGQRCRDCVDTNTSGSPEPRLNCGF